jgi:sugar/nucleoside kinase (ribokinase family)
MKNKIIVSGVGCCLVDYLYNNISFASESFSKYISRQSGDGGLTPGKLVFADEFARFTGADFVTVIQEITGGKPADSINIGGPGIVALIHAAQMLDNENCEVRFYGGPGNDDAGNYLQSTIANTPVNIENYRPVSGTTPSTIVLSDPDYCEGNGERIFINSIGAAGNYRPEYLNDSFFLSDVVVFGGTALVPAIHDNMTGLLARAKSGKCITVVNTVYDFRNEKANPSGKWPLGEGEESYRNIDLLITNREEALRLSGESHVTGALDYFRGKGTGAVIVTNGANPVALFAGRESIFTGPGYAEMPVSEAISAKLAEGHNGDTTGCGDNFAGGAIASLVAQLLQKRRKIELTEACIWGIVSGGYSCFYMGGTYLQKEPGEKRKLITPFYNDYEYQVKNG